MSLRRGDWKLLDHKGSGGNKYDRKGGCLEPFAIQDTDPDAPGQLCNLREDPGETNNVYSKYPEIVADLRSLLEDTKKSGRSAPTR